MKVSINFSIISTEDIVEESSISPRFLSGPSIHVASVLDTAKGWLSLVIVFLSERPKYKNETVN